MSKRKRVHQCGRFTRVRNRACLRTAKRAEQAGRSGSEREGETQGNARAVKDIGPFLATGTFPWSPRTGVLSSSRARERDRGVSLSHLIASGPAI